MRFVRFHSSDGVRPLFVCFMASPSLQLFVIVLDCATPIYAWNLKSVFDVELSVAHQTVMSKRRFYVNRLGWFRSTSERDGEQSVPRLGPM